MDLERLFLLEQAIEPYRRAGFVVTSQTEGSITLTLPQEKFSYAFFLITLILVWPVAVVYLISFNNQRGRNVCLRVTSQGYIEASGYTLGAIARERKHKRLVTILLLSIFAIIILLILMRFYWAGAR
jgi:hypothetical protein